MDETLRDAYENTLQAAAREGAEDFKCGKLNCKDCPFVMKYDGSCSDPTVEGGAGYKRTVAEWQQWWYEQTGERDTRTREQILDGVDSDSTDTVETADTTPTVDIAWSNAVGGVKQRTCTMSLLTEELDLFRRELSVWLECMNRPAEQIGNSLAERIYFTATAEDGTPVAEIDLSAEQFGKCKAWRSLEK